MRWSIDKGVDGVITDDPELFRKVCGEWETGGGALGADGKPSATRLTLKQKVNVLVVATGAYLAGGLLMLVFRGRIRRFAKERKHLGHGDGNSN